MQEFGKRDTKKFDELRQTVNDIAQQKMQNRLLEVQLGRQKAEKEAIGTVLTNYRNNMQGKPTSHDALTPNENFGGILGAQSTVPKLEISPEEEKQHTVDAYSNLMAIGTPNAQKAATGVVNMYKITRTPQARTEFGAYLQMYGNDYGKAVDAYRKAKTADRMAIQSKAARAARAPNKYDLLMKAAGTGPEADRAKRALQIEAETNAKGTVLRSETDRDGNIYDVHGYTDEAGQEIVTGYTQRNKGGAKKKFNINDPAVRKILGLPDEQPPAAADSTGGAGKQKSVTDIKSGETYTDGAGNQYQYIGGDKSDPDSWKKIK